jgi:hypothetical protein
MPEKEGFKGQALWRQIVSLATRSEQNQGLEESVPVPIL